jgi:hypothetical protein
VTVPIPPPPEAVGQSPASLLAESCLSASSASSSRRLKS